MTSENEPIVVVGAGQAGGRAARILRDKGFAGPITLIGDEAHLPYERPPLSKDCLVKPEVAAPAAVNPSEFYDFTGIAKHLSCPAERIDTAARTVVLADGNRISYAKLLLATGSRPRRLPELEKGPLPLTYLRTIDDAQWLAPRLIPKSKVVVIGGGVIGLEVAASASTRGCTVTIIEAGQRIMARCVNPSVSAIVASRHRQSGVTIILRRTVTATSYDRGQGFVQLDNMETIPADLVVAGVGIVPNTELAEKAGLAVENGIVVDAQCQTSDPNIYAAGDATQQYQTYLGRKARLENWASANDQAERAALHMLGKQASCTSVPWFWTDQYDLNIQVAGDIDGDNDVVRGDVGSNRFCVFHLRNDVIVGATAINAARDMNTARRLIKQRIETTSVTIADPGINLRNLAL